VEHEPVGTRLALILAGGELFAEFGLDGTSVRAIAEKADANIAAINYHFGSKENLYTEVLRYAVLRGTGLRPSVLLKDNEERLTTPAGIAQILRQIVKEWFASYFSPDQPRWFGRVLVRSLLDPTPSLQEILKEIFEPDQQAVRAIIRRANPAMSEQQARLWAYSLTGQVAFYEFCRVPILMTMQKDNYDKAFIDAAAEHTAALTIAGLGLPQPGDRIDGTTHEKPES